MNGEILSENEKYEIEIKTLEPWCQHRTHCLIYNTAELLKVQIICKSF